MKNVIWFISDQYRYHAVSSHGDTNVSMPNMDWLAATVWTGHGEEL